MQARRLVWLFLIAPVIASHAAEPGSNSSLVSKALAETPVAIANSQQFDFTSKVNGRTYRIMAWLPEGAVAGKQYPALYVLDGNFYFGTATDAAARMSFSNSIAPLIVVGIGYPAQGQRQLWTERSYDLTPSESTDLRWRGKFGGGKAFADVLRKELQPLILGRLPIDPRKQVLWGHSFGGLFALGVMFRNPGDFSAYVLSSPSIWWNGREALLEEPTFTHRISESRTSLRVLITSAADEQYRGTDPKELADDTDRMVDNATELASRLKSTGQSQLSVSRVIFEGEIHTSVQQASISRALRFAFPVGQKAAD